MPRYYLSGGRQRVSRFVRREEWSSFEAAVLLELDTDTAQVRSIFEYQGAADRVPATDPSHIFKTASWDDHHLLLCTQTEVLVFDPKECKVERTISHPCFNDVHHAARIGGKIHVVSTGLDAVFALDENDAISGEFGATGADPWARFDRHTDYRRVATTKPHAAHPNFVFESAGTGWVTRFEQRDAVRLDGRGSPLKVADAPIHDGLPVGEHAWFTAVRGEVIQAHPAHGKRIATYDLNTFPRASAEPLGWCRGIHVERARTLVGFSRLRPTLFKQNLSWLRAAANRPEPLPTRVTAYDLAAGRELQSWPLEASGMSAVFGILPVDRGGI